VSAKVFSFADWKTASHRGDNDVPIVPANDEPVEQSDMDIEGLTKLIEQQSSTFTRLIEQQSAAFTRLFEQQSAAIERIEKKVDQIADKVTDIDKRLVAVESQLPHLASKSWVQVTLAVAAAGAIAAIGSIFTIINTAGLPHH
jgi:septal ring factor EnvC (AmiA/AmiB activator)